MSLCEGGQLSPTGGKTGHGHTLGSLSDVDTQGAETGDALVFTGDGWQPGTGSVDVPALPAPVNAQATTTGQVVVATAFANLPGTAATSVALTTDFDCWVIISYSAWLMGTFTSGQELRCGVAGTGATIFAEQTTESNWGNILHAGISQGTAGAKQHSATRVVKLLAGTTTVTMRAYIVGTPTAPEVRYPQLVVTPFAYDGLGALIGRGATGPTGPAGTGLIGPTGPTGPAGSGGGGGGGGATLQTTGGATTIEIGMAGNGAAVGQPDSAVMDLKVVADPAAHGYIWTHPNGGVVVAADDGGGGVSIDAVFTRDSWSSWVPAYFLSDLTITDGLGGAQTFVMDAHSGDLTILGAISSPTIEDLQAQLAAQQTITEDLLERPRVFTGDVEPWERVDGDAWIPETAGL